jgi:hypothetical protein
VQSVTRPVRWPSGIKETDPIETAEMWTRWRISMPGHSGEQAASLKRERGNQSAATPLPVRTPIVR